MYLRLFLAGKQSGRGYGYAAIQHRQREINQKHPFSDMYPQYWVSSIGGTYQDSRSFLSFRLVAGVTLQWFPCRSRTGISNIVTILYCAPVFFRRKSGSRCRRLSGKRYWFCSCVRLDISTRRGARSPAAPAPVSAARSFHNPIPAQSAETGLPECFLRRPEYGLYRPGSRFPALGYGRTPATRGPARISTRPFYGYAV